LEAFFPAQAASIIKMAASKNLSYTMHLEVYLHAAVVRGVLETNQDRLSNYLVVRQGEEVFSLKDATLEMFSGKPLSVGADEYLIYLQEVLLIADLSSEGGVARSNMEALYVQKDRSKALLSVGPYVLRGNVHLLPGSALHDLLMEKSQFLPVTEATLIDRQDIGPRTYLVNRAKIGFMTAIGDGLIEL
jgi:uncharacterized protein DUF6812